MYFWAKILRDDCALCLSGNLFSAHTICVFVTSYFKMFSRGRKIPNLNQKCTIHLDQHLDWKNWWIQCIIMGKKCYLPTYLPTYLPKFARYLGWYISTYVCLLYGSKDLEEDNSKISTPSIASLETYFCQRYK